MDMHSKQQYLKKLQKEYRNASKSEKGKILDEYVKNINHNRKYVIGQFNNINLVKKEAVIRKKRGSIYTNRLNSPLKFLYEIFDFPCGQRLKPIIETELDRLRSFGEINISDIDAQLLKKMSSATIDRKIKEIRSNKQHSQFTTTKPGTLLKQNIPIRLTDWDTQKIGFQEVDLVAHCGSNSSGNFASTISLTEIASGWWEGYCMLGKGQITTLNGIKQIRTRTPYPWLGLDSDNGGEFINHHLVKYCQNEQIFFTRSRPNYKNDNAYIEQKNWTHVRKIFGYYRYDTKQEIDLINDLLCNELRLYKNFFQPIMKLKSKNRVEAKLKRIYEKPITPYLRLIQSSQISDEIKMNLKSIYQTLNPAYLKRQIKQKLYRLYLFQEQKSWQPVQNLHQNLQILNHNKMEVLVR